MMLPEIKALETTLKAIDKKLEGMRGGTVIADGKRMRTVIARRFTGQALSKLEEAKDLMAQVPPMVLEEPAKTMVPVIKVDVGAMKAKIEADKVSKVAAPKATPKKKG